MPTLITPRGPARSTPAPGGALARALRAAALAAALAAAPACSLTETGVAEGDDLLVVEAVLRTDVLRQVIVLHRGVSAGVALGEPAAVVTVRDVGTGDTYTFQPEEGCYRIDPRYFADDSLDFRGSCYVSSPFDGRWVRPGSTYELEVHTPRGEVARGRTTAPGVFSLLGVPAGGALGAPQRCALAPATTLSLAWTRSRGAWSYVSDLRVHGLRAALQPVGIDDAPDPMELRGLAVSEEDTTIVFPTEYGVFERFRYDQDVLLAIQDGFPEGVLVQMTTAAADRNYVNGVRGGSFNPSGQVRISSVVGDGVGVFGSLVVLHTIVEVGDRPTLPRCLGAGGP